eukprot:scpid28258/ scgid17761/ 
MSPVTSRVLVTPISGASTDNSHSRGILGAQTLPLLLYCMNYTDRSTPTTQFQAPTLQSQCRVVLVLSVSIKIENTLTARRGQAGDDDTLCTSSRKLHVH